MLERSRSQVDAKKCVLAYTGTHAIIFLMEASVVDSKDPDLSSAAKALSGGGGAAKGGLARAKALTGEERSELSRKAAKARWAAVKSGKEVKAPNRIPEAKFRGVLSVLDLEVPCYVLDNGQRVIGRTSATELLTGIKGGGALEKYLDTKNLNPFINIDLVLERLIEFRLPEVEGLERQVKGLEADQLIEICRGFVAALEASNNDPEIRLTDKQRAMAIKAGMFLAACAKTGLDALIDEVTGNQYERASDALRVKLKAYLLDEMRKWEKTFPDQLWLEFARLTHWKGSVTQRPKYWGHLVNELIYEYLDPDVAEWLKTHAPRPEHGQNYHQWLTEQFGLAKLTQHIWMVIGVSKTCQTMNELKTKLAEMFGRIPVQFQLFLPPPTT